MNKVLLVEDDPRVASFITRGLEENLYEVKTITKGFEAIKEVMENEYSIIILDIMLPDITGFEVCELLRSRKIIVPILF